MAESGKKWGVIMLMGEYQHNIDDKGRLTVPSKFRQELGKKVVITRGLEHSLMLFTEEKFSEMSKSLNALPFTKKDIRNFTRFFLSGATVSEFDKQGRLNINSSLQKHAFLDKECIIIGVGDHLEIWDKTRWQEFYEDSVDAMSDIAENIYLGESNE